MEITEEQYGHVKHCFPVQRGNVKLSNLVILNAYLYRLENGCKWRNLPEEFGKWQTVYRRVRRWNDKGILGEVLRTLYDMGVLLSEVEVASLDSSVVKVHPDGTGARKSSGPQSIGKSRGGWTTKIHMIAGDDRTALVYDISPGQAHDAPKGRDLIRSLPPHAEPDQEPARDAEPDQEPARDAEPDQEPARDAEPDQEPAGEAGPSRPGLRGFLAMDRAYEGDETRKAAEKAGFTPVVPPKKP